MPVRSSLISLVLLLAVLGVSLSGPLVRLSHAHPIAIAIWRLILSLGIIAIPLVAQGSCRQWRTLDARSYTIAVIGGVLLALHFWSWNTSLRMTTIAASVVLVNVQPLIVAALSVVWLREARHASNAGESRSQPWAPRSSCSPICSTRADCHCGRAVVGDALVAIGALMAAGYYVVGRRARGRDAARVDSSGNSGASNALYTDRRRICTGWNLLAEGKRQQG